MCNGKNYRKMKSDQILFFSPYWGYENIPLKDFLPKIKDTEFDGIEINIVFRPLSVVHFLFEEAHRLNLKIITQVAGLFESNFQAYKKAYLENLQFQVSLNPFLINCHTGSDFYRFEENLELIQEANLLSKNSGIKIIHETHRGRFSYSPSETSKYIEAVPELRLVADFSHWCVVTESLLENHSGALQAAISRSDHIHSRIGHAQGPQVSDPRLPEWENELNAHLDWWDSIVQNHKSENSVLGITTEFGPPKYMPTLPEIGKVQEKQWAINLHMKELLGKRYNEKSKIV